ncbi:hypothetical protein BH10CHL1_BH10CHL1_13850 [soil metagenome]
MALLTKEEITNALQRLGALAQQQGQEIELLVVGGAAMVLAYNARLATHDVDGIVLLSTQTQLVHRLAHQIAQEMEWPNDWLNDGAKGYLVGISRGPILFVGPGIRVRQPTVEQLLAMKLCAWRDDVDIEDARRLLQELKHSQEEIWKMVEPYLLPGRELKARYAFLDLWETNNGEN